MSEPLNAKQLAGARAAEYIEDGMAVGLGTGSTAYWMVEALGARVRQGLRVRGVPTSRRTEEQARTLGIALVTFAEVQQLDLTIDGADEIDPNLALTKGGGGALLREKLVAAASRRMIVVADSSKLVQTLGKFPLPVEVVPFAWEVTAGRVEALGCNPRLRRAGGGDAYVTDNGNYILDCDCGVIADPARLERELKLLPGVVECGLFVRMADTVVVADEAGGVRIIERAG
ncbi:MAG TPA: ribose-5-phosphate isomerase RpiA [Pyrinomonadaceae bacterium]|nr:ribose-5-phosphate isomerase RpiA [Pyrinomonadaceae bacterium]